MDDIAVNRKLLRVCLEPEGFSLLEATDGIEALQTLEHSSVDVIVSDVLMPRMDGYRLCHALRESERHRRVPVILTSSTYTDASDEDLALRSGADRYLRKPLNPAELVAILRSLVTSPNLLPQPAAPVAEELVIMNEYSEALVRKLKEKNDILSQTQTELLRSYDEMEQRVAERTRELKAANDSLKGFAYTISHDLRAPLRHIASHARFVLDDPANALSETSRDDLNRAVSAARKLNIMIEALLRFSSLGESKLQLMNVSLTELVARARLELEAEAGHRQIIWQIAPLPVIRADPQLLYVVLVNLLSNAVKYTGQRETAVIEVGSFLNQNNEHVLFVRDNGAGFDMAYADKLFGVFSRLHLESEFEGTGIGLAIVRRIIGDHGGKTWAESKPGEGATFYFSVPST